MTVRRVVSWLRVETVLGLVGLLIAVAGGLSSSDEALTYVRPLWPVVGFLASVLVVARCCAVSGLFASIGVRVARAGGGRPRVLLVLSFVAAAVITALLNLDATIVLLTPVLISAALHSQVATTPVAWTCIRLANSASLLFSVSNLTNLLAVAHRQVTFLEFAWLTWPVWLVVLVLEWVAARVWFRTDLREPGVPVSPQAQTRLPRFTLAVVLLMLVGFVIGSYTGVDPVWPAATAAAVLAVRAVITTTATPHSLVVAANLPLAFLVLCWALAVEQLVHTGLGELIAGALPLGPGVLSTVGLALTAMLLANLVNNLPAALVLIPLVVPHGTTALIAVLIGLNVGANLTYVGSLANVLWLRTAGPSRPSHVRFHVMSLTTTPAIVTVAALTLAGWSSLT